MAMMPCWTLGSECPGRWTRCLFRRPWWLVQGTWWSFPGWGVKLDYVGGLCVALLQLLACVAPKKISGRDENAKVK